MEKLNLFSNCELEISGMSKLFGGDWPTNRGNGDCICDNNGDGIINKGDTTEYY